MASSWAAELGGFGAAQEARHGDVGRGERGGARADRRVAAGAGELAALGWRASGARAASIRRQVGEGARGKRAAEWPADDADARAQARQRTGDGGSSSSDMIL